MSNSADNAPSAACNSTKAATSASRTRLSERSRRHGGQNSVTVPWLLPANSAIATAMPNKARSQRAARIAYFPATAVASTAIVSSMRGGAAGRSGGGAGGGGAAAAGGGRGGGAK